MNREINQNMTDNLNMVVDEFPMITISEEVFLLILDYDNGCTSYELSPSVMRGMIAGAILLDLSEQNRIEIDNDSLIVINPAPTGYPVLDYTMSWIGKKAIKHHVDNWISRFSKEAEVIQQKLLELLVERGILSHCYGDRYFVMGSRHFISRHGVPFRDVRRRIAGILLCRETPTPRDRMIIHLASECGLWNDLIDDSAMDVLSSRIQDIGRIDMIGRSVTSLVHAGL